jgi:hypothetical protein
MIGLGSGKAMGLHLLVEAVTVLHFCLSVMPVPFSKVAVSGRGPCGDLSVLQVWDTASGQLRLTLTGHIEQVRGEHSSA